jgi:hypothetical protein
MRSRVAIAALVLLGMACGSQNANQRRMVSRRVSRIDTAQSREDRSRCDASRPGRTQSEYDTNGDGIPDVRKVYEVSGEGAEIRSTLVCREVDLDHDGTKDMFRFYNAEGRTLREEEDRDFDGRIDVITFFDRGEVVRRELDTNRDGQVDMRVFYRERRPYRAERELNSNNDASFRADYWEYYDARGQIVRIGWDYNGDERADQWDRTDRVTPNAPTGEVAGDGEDGGAPMSAGDAGLALSIADAASRG